MWKKLYALKPFIFASIGVINTCIDFGVTIILIQILQPSTTIVLLSINTFAFLVGTINSYILNKTFTFQDQNSHSIQKILTFLLISLLSLVVNNIAFLTTLQLVSMQSQSAPLFWVIIAKIIATTSSLFVNYWGYTYFVFHNHPSSDTNPNNKINLQ